MKDIKLSTQPYKGTTDTYPQEMLVRNLLFQTWSKVAKEYGYEEYDTPMLEEANLYRAKSGDEIANTQLYNFTDKGGREVALRPEMTPSVARMIAARENEIIKPIRWFNIGRYYRYEKPQRGRKREFFQLNIDIFGIPTIEAELEIIQFTMSVMDQLKAPKETYELRLNNRYLLDYLFSNILELEEEKKPIVARAIDNSLKMGPTKFKEYLFELELSETQVEKLLDFLTWDISRLKDIKEESRGAKELLELFSKAKDLGIENIKFYPSIMRGFQYYTGTVIEMFDIGSSENPRALFGGGRYDDLLDIFGKEKLPAFGLGWGDITMLDYMKTYNLVPDIKTETDIYITLLNKDLYLETNKLSQYLREQGLKVQTQLTEEKLGKQFKYADKKGFKWVAILGEEEIDKDVVQLKNMQTGESVSIKKEDIIEQIKSN